MGHRGGWSSGSRWSASSAPPADISYPTRRPFGSVEELATDFCTLARASACADRVTWSDNPHAEQREVRAGPLGVRESESAATQASSAGTFPSGGALDIEATPPADGTGAWQDASLDRGAGHMKNRRYARALLCLQPVFPMLLGKGPNLRLLRRQAKPRAVLLGSQIANFIHGEPIGRNKVHPLSDVAITQVCRVLRGNRIVHRR